MKPKKSKIIEGTEYGLFVQLIGFSVFWALPSLWMWHLVKATTDIEVSGILLWLAMIVLNLATYSLGRNQSAGVNAAILHSLMLVQIYAWIFV